MNGPIYNELMANSVDDKSMRKWMDEVLQNNGQWRKKSMANEWMNTQRNWY